MMSQMIEYSNFFEEGFNLKCDKDVYHYLDALAQNNIEEQNMILDIGKNTVKLIKNEISKSKT